RSHGRRPGGGAHSAGVRRADGGTVLIAHERRRHDRLLWAEVHITGSASLPDLERTVFYGEEWRDDWAALRDPGPPQVDVALTRLGNLGDKHHRLAWQRLAPDPYLLAEYRALKERPVDYEVRKREFFERVVTSL